MTDQPRASGDDGLAERTTGIGSASARPHPSTCAVPLSGRTGAVHADGRSRVRRTAESSPPAPVLPPQSWPHTSTLELAALPTAVACGRLHTRHLLREWQLDSLAEDAAILVSELLTNAVIASRSLQRPSFVTLRLLASREHVVIEVWDQNPHDPRSSRADDDAEHGRGFMVIDALSSRWGYRRVSASLKVVWCELVIVRD